MKFRKKPLIVEAIQYTGNNGTKILHFINPNLPKDATAFGGTIETLEGIMQVKIGDWIIRGIKGEIYPCKPDIFEKTYELINK